MVALSHFFVLVLFFLFFPFLAFFLVFSLACGSGPCARRYMHNPEMWGLVQFADDRVGQTALCFDPSWPARFVLTNAYRALVTHAM
jgi:hypothetical protein